MSKIYQKKEALSRKVKKIFSFADTTKLFYSIFCIFINFLIILPCKQKRQNMVNKISEESHVYDYKFDVIKGKLVPET